VTDVLLSDALFLDQYPSWSQRDLDDADQTLVEHLSTIAYEKAVRAKEQADQAEREAWAARARSRLQH